MSTTTDSRQIVLEAVSTRLKAAEGALDMVDTPKPEGLLHLPLRRHMLSAARADVKLAKQILVLHKMHLGTDLHQMLLDQANVLQERVYNTNIHPGLQPVIPQES